MAGSGTAAWLPKRPEQEPGISSPRGGLPVARGAHTRNTRPFRFGSEDQPDPDPPFVAGDLIGERYRIVGLLGEGGMGRVYEAEHTVLHRRVALKLLRRDATGSAAAENLARFQQEALAASRIGAPQIVEIADFATHMGPGTRGQPQTYMVMELLVGESLEDWMDRPARLDEGLALLAELCDGLAAAHQAGVVHRDIKPANIFVRADASVYDFIKMLDFGLVTRGQAPGQAGGDGAKLTAAGFIVGTPSYMAPEQATDPDVIDHRSDLYSLGV
ncbi:MAG: serine/threonine protein kinase, partial [Myxococcales bacterium]|nr:serine/threonine protein kinase [Myxococcales bacterium]